MNGEITRAIVTLTTNLKKYDADLGAANDTITDLKGSYAADLKKKDTEIAKLVAQIAADKKTSETTAKKIAHEHNAAIAAANSKLDENTVEIDRLKGTADGLVGAFKAALASDTLDNVDEDLRDMILERDSVITGEVSMALFSESLTKAAMIVKADDISNAQRRDINELVAKIKDFEGVVQNFVGMGQQVLGKRAKPGDNVPRAQEIPEGPYYSNGYDAPLPGNGFEDLSFCGGVENLFGQ